MKIMKEYDYCKLKLFLSHSQYLFPIKYELKYDFYFMYVACEKSLSLLSLNRHQTQHLEMEPVPNDFRQP